MPAVLFYVQHLLGIGHLMRARLVAEALAAAGFDVHLVSGGRPVEARPPLGVRTIQLPPIHATDAGLKPLRDLDGCPIDEAFRAKRRDLLLAEFDAIAPAALIFETFPFGRRALHFELVPLLERALASRPRPLIVASVRDILQRQPNAARGAEMLALAHRGFDAVLVHGDSRFIPFDATFPQAPELASALHYTGFVAATVAPLETATQTERGEIVVSAGGGAVGARLLRAALQAKPRSALGDRRWRLLAGANVGDDEIRALARAADPGTIVEVARPDFPALLRRAFLSVSQAGYNTVQDVMRSGARAVFAPYAEDGESEQTDRATRLHQLGLAEVIEGGAITPDALAAAIDRAGSSTRRVPWDFDCDGATRSAALVKELLAAHSGRSGVRAAVSAATAYSSNARAWERLDVECAAWERGGRSPTLWWRDDDACRDTPALRRLVSIAAEQGVPIALAVVPAALDQGLVGAVAQAREATVIQHGYAHRNHAPGTERSRELGRDRPMSEVVAELDAGRTILQSAFGPRFAGVLVPPWNRIDSAIVASLPALGLHGLSTLGPRAAVHPVPGVVQSNAHVDLIAWRDARAFVGVAAAIDRLVDHLRARREGAVDPDEPTGILTHHLDMDAAGWEFLVAILSRTRAGGATWLDAAAVFGEPAHVALTSGRSA